MKKIYSTLLLLTVLVFAGKAQDDDVEDFKPRRTSGYKLTHDAIDLREWNLATHDTTSGYRTAEKGLIFDIVRGANDNKASIIKFWTINEKTGKQPTKTLESQKEEVEKSIKTLSAQRDSGIWKTEGKRLVDLRNRSRYSKAIKLKVDIEAKLPKVKPTEAKKEEVTTDITYKDNGKYFIIDRTYLDTIQIPHYYTPVASFTFGTTVIPAKLRFKTKTKDGSDTTLAFNFTPDFEIGLQFGLKLKTPKNPNFSISLLTGFGGSLVIADGKTTGNYLTQTTSIGAFSVHGGLVFDYKSFQVGVMLGGDIATGALAEKWAYHAKPWLGLGIGYNIYTTGAKGKKEQTQP